MSRGLSQFGRQLGGSLQRAVGFAFLKRFSQSIRLRAGPQAGEWSLAGFARPVSFRMPSRCLVRLDLREANPRTRERLRPQSTPTREPRTHSESQRVGIRAKHAHHG